MSAEDLIGAEDGPKKGASFFSSKPSTKAKSSVFSLGQRAAVLDELDAEIIVPHAAKETGGKDAKDKQNKTETRFPYERLFRSLQ